MKNRISRFFLLALLLLMTIAPVRAEIVGQTTENEYIHRLIADNGQELCFVSGEKDPSLSYADVNFDGINDVVILTQRGASNFVYQFFISDGEQYVLCPLTFTNYDLDAEHKIVRSCVNGGLAGGIHRETLYRFDGTEAVLLRWAVGEEKEDWTFDADGYTIRHYNDVLTLQVWEHDPDMDGILIFEQDVSTEDENALREAFQAENDALWSGIR